MSAQLIQVMGHSPKKPVIKNKVIIDYLPHGINTNIYKPLTLDSPGNMLKSVDKEGKLIAEISEFEEFLEFKKRLFKGKEYDFVVLYNNRNIRRKMPGDVILAFKTFWDTLSEDVKPTVALLMHTHPIDENGTNLFAVKEAVAPDINLIFSTDKLEQRMMNYLYNVADITINMASNEGYGLSTAESLLAETPIIVNVTGGLQDQCGFVDEKGNMLDPDKHFNSDWGSNHDRKYINHGKWVYPLYPTNRALVGSPPTPYIFDDRCSWEDAAQGMKYWYNKTPDERTEAGKLGKQFMFDTGMTAQDMGLRFIDYIDYSIENFIPRERFNLMEV